MYIPYPPKSPRCCPWCNITLFMRACTFLPISLFYIFLITPLDLLSGYSLMFDLCTRISINDSPVGTYYFWWTSMTYLPTFFFFLLFILLLVQPSLVHSSVVFFSLTIFGAIYTAEIFDYMISNQNLFISTYSSSGLNTLLTNVLNRYHPLVFYLSTFLLLTWFFFTFASPPQHFYFWFESSCFSSTCVQWITLFVNLTALWMGSWWALQEGTWGGWWNWDSSEVFGLFVTLVILSTTHSKTLTRNLEYTRAKTIILAAIFVASYVFIQLNFELVSHNFGSKFFFFFNNNLFFIQLLVLLTLALIHTYTSILLSKRDNDLLCYSLKRHLSSFKSKSILRLLPSFVLSLWVLISYKPLLNYFLWNFFDLNFFNSENTFQIINCVLVLIVLAWFISVSRTYLLFLVVFSFYTSHHLLIVSMLFALSKSVYRYHVCFALLAALNILLFDNIIYRWSTYLSHYHTLLGYPLLINTSSYSTLDSCSIELVQSTLTSEGRLDLSWNLSSVTNVPALNFFNLVTSSNSFYNLYELASNYITIHLYIELPLIPSINLLFWIPCSYLMTHVFKTEVLNKI